MILGKAASTPYTALSLSFTCYCMKRAAPAANHEFDDTHGDDWVNGEIMRSSCCSKCSEVYQNEMLARNGRYEYDDDALCWMRRAQRLARLGSKPGMTSHRLMNTLRRDAATAGAPGKECTGTRTRRTRGQTGKSFTGILLEWIQKFYCLDIPLPRTKIWALRYGDLTCTGWIEFGLIYNFKTERTCRVVACMHDETPLVFVKRQTE